MAEAWSPRCRQAELQRVGALLDRDRVVALTGPGGVGKTRLALAVAAGRAAQLTDGVWLCDLGAVRDPTLVDDALATVFSVQAPAPRPVAVGQGGGLHPGPSLRGVAQDARHSCAG